MGHLCPWELAMATVTLDKRATTIYFELINEPGSAEKLSRNLLHSAHPSN
jgi:hypothetical protein